MANVEVGSAYVSIYPDTSSFSSRLGSSLNGMESVGMSAGKSVSGGFGKALSVGKIAIGNMIADFASSAMSSISSSLGSAINRVDTLQQFPKTMTALGYSADVADKSIQNIADHMMGLPGTTQDMAQFVQGLTAATGDLDKSTKVGLAFSDMLTIAGANTMDAANAQAMFTKMMATGKYDGQKWQSLVSTMPGSLKVVSEALLGAGNDANTLGEAWKNGTVSAQDIMDKMIELDTVGYETADGLVTLEQTARDASGGIGTSMENLGNRMTASLANVLHAIGEDAIGSEIERISTGILGFSKDIAAGIKELKEDVDFTPLVEGFHAIEDTIGAIAYAGLDAVIQGIKDFADWASEIGDILSQYDFSPYVSGVQDYADAWEKLAGAEIQAIAEGIKTLVEKMAPFVEKVGPLAETLLGSIADNMRYLGEQLPGVTSGFETFSTLGPALDVLGALAGVLDGIATTLREMGGMMQSAGGVLSSFVSGDVQGAISKLAGMSARAETSFDNVSSKWNTALGNAKSTASTQMDSALKNAQTTMASFKKAGEDNPLTFKVNKPTLPKVSVSTLTIAGATIPQFSWKAKGGLFDGPSIIGVGEAGKEAAIPLEGRHMRPFAQTIAAEMHGSTNSSTTFNVNYSNNANANDMARDLSRLWKRYELAKGA